MPTPSAADRWYALQVRARREHSIATQLTGKGYRIFLPTFKAKKRWNGRVTEQKAALFPGYLFCHFDISHRLPILVTHGVLAVVGRGRTPVPVEDSEISALQTVVGSGLPTEPWPYLEVGQAVRIEDGALSGLEGILASFKGGSRIVVSVSLLRRSVALEIDRVSVSPVHSSRPLVFDSFRPSQLLEGAFA
jgi:transcription termination/antitermination protein NusG